MFKLNKLTLVGVSQTSFDYEFDESVNYYVGANNTGKTVFFDFIDYMLGASVELKSKDWFRNSLKYAVLSITSNGISFDLRRSIDPEENYIKYSDEDWNATIALEEYKARLGAIVNQNQSGLAKFRSVVGEDLTFRTFTLFSFLGEKALGNTIDFFERGKSIKYSTKLPLILNYLFNKNLPRILALKQELTILQKNLSEIEANRVRADFIQSTINNNLSILNVEKQFDGKNRDVILSEIRKLQALEIEQKAPKKAKTFVELESIYSNISDQIKIYESSISDNKIFLAESTNKEKLLQTLDNLIANKPHLSYLATSIQHLIGELKSSISFNSYSIESNTISELKRQLSFVRTEIKKSAAKVQLFESDQKIRSINVIESLLAEQSSFENTSWSETRRRIAEIKQELKIIQGLDDDKIINNISECITELYCAAKEVSAVVGIDCSKPGFKIQYFKKGNLLQPQVASSSASDTIENYYTGSMARQTLIQLCGYLAFMRLLVSDADLPVIPILVIDHISKPFDQTNRNAIGKILGKFHSFKEAANCQIFMFDDEAPGDLSISYGKAENLASEIKTGFNPFYVPNNAKQ